MKRRQTAAAELHEVAELNARTAQAMDQRHVFSWRRPDSFLARDENSRSFWSATTARKVNQPCADCGQPIVKGERMYRPISKRDTPKVKRSARVCKHCVEAVEVEG